MHKYMDIIALKLDSPVKRCFFILFLIGVVIQIITFIAYLSNASSGPFDYLRMIFGKYSWEAAYRRTFWLSLLLLAIGLIGSFYYDKTLGRLICWVRSGQFRPNAEQSMIKSESNSPSLANGKSSANIACGSEERILEAGVSLTAQVLTVMDFDNLSTADSKNQANQLYMINVFSASGNYFTTATAAGPNSLDLSPGDLVLWQVDKYSEELASLSRSGCSGWTGSITAKVNPQSNDGSWCPGATVQSLSAELEIKSTSDDITTSLNANSVLQFAVPLISQASPRDAEIANRTFVKNRKSDNFLYAVGIIYVSCILLVLGIIIHVFGTNKISEIKETPVITAEASNSSWGGLWYRADSDKNERAVLAISNITASDFHFRVLANYGFNVGEIVDAVAIINQNSASFKLPPLAPGELPCDGIFIFTYEAITFRTSNCSGYGGFGVSFDGTYTRETAATKVLTLYEIGVFKQQEQDKVFRNVVGQDYQLFVDTFDLFSMHEKQGEVVITGGLRGDFLFRQGIIIYRNDGSMMAAVLNNNTIKYFSNNPDYETELPESIEIWRQKHPERKIVFVSQIKDRPSFDCTAANKPSEVLICKTQELSALDFRMSATYIKALAAATDKSLLRRKQALWLLNVRDLCKDVPCLRKAYMDRIAELEVIIGETVDR